MDYLPLWIGGEVLGQVPRRLAPVLGIISQLVVTEDYVQLLDVGLTTKHRSEILQRVALQLKKNGLILDWRNELCAVLDTKGQEVGRCERGAFRALGIQNRAVHVTARREDGQYWIARRSATKRAGAGMLDNFAAGGVSAGESLWDCGIRELWEEAGVPPQLSSELFFPEVALRSLRETASGLHDELVIVAELVLPNSFQPINRDSEVAEFLRLNRAEVEAALEGGEFTIEAALATRCVLQRHAR
ncbi:MAG: DUF4743 domain-containing protein [Gammaproteobacteria bacterium]|nr:DUF4743 domain-containing protein [Gammaproteobacteria bacterium]